MIVMLGMVGAGKTVQARLLAERHGWHWLSTGELLRQSADKTVQERLRGGQLFSDAEVQELVATELAALPEARQIVFDGFPRRIGQAQWLDDQLAKSGKAVDCALHLTIDIETAHQRLGLRERDDDTADAIAARTAEYEKWVVPVVDFYASSSRLAPVNAIGTVEEIAGRIDGILRDKRLI